MRILKSRKGMSLPTVLGIVAFVLGTTATLLSYVFFQSRLVNMSIENTEAYENAVQKVDATLKIISRDKLLDKAYLDSLGEHMGVTISLQSENLWIVTSMVNDSKFVASYITGSTTTANTYDLIFQKTEEPDLLNMPWISASNLLSSYLPKYIETNFPWISPQTEFTTFQSVIDYIKTLAIANNGFELHYPNVLINQLNPTALSHWYIEGNVTLSSNKSLTVPSNRLLVINGNLTVGENSVIKGNVIVNGTVTIDGQGNSLQTLEGTIYAKGNVIIEKKMQFGPQDRPSFIFSEGTIKLSNQIDGYAYLLCQKLEAIGYGSIDVTGGFYSVIDKDKQLEAQKNLYLKIDEFYDYAVPLTIEVENTDPNSAGSGKFKYTSPRLTS